MTRSVGEKGQISLPKPFQHGDVVTLESTGRDTLILQRRKAAARSPRKKLVRCKDGSTYITGGMKVTPELVKQIMAEFP